MSDGRQHYSSPETGTFVIDRNASSKRCGIAMPSPACCSADALFFLVDSLYKSLHRKREVPRCTHTSDWTLRGKGSLQNATSSLQREERKEKERRKQT